MAMAPSTHSAPFLFNQRTQDITPFAVELQRRPLGHVPLLQSTSQMLFGVHITANPGSFAHESGVQNKFVQMLSDEPHIWPCEHADES